MIRNIRFPGLSRQASGSTDGHQYSTRLGLSYSVDFGPFQMIPETEMTYIRLDQDAFTESGAGSLNLRVSEHSSDSLRSYIGMRFDIPVRMAEKVQVMPWLRVGWIHEYLDEGRTVTARFADLPGSFRVSVADPKRDRARLGGGLRIGIGTSITGLLEYSAELNDETTDQFVSAGIEFRFP